MSATDTARPQAPSGAKPPSAGDRRKATRRGGWVLLGVLVAAVLLVAWVIVNARSGGQAAGGRGGRGGGRGGGGAGGAPTSVNALKTGVGDMPIYLDALGTVTPPATVTVQSQEAGQLLSVTFREGQDVTKGQLLAQVDPRPYQAALASAQGALARDAATLANARVDLARYAKLLTEDSIASQQVDTQRSTVRQDEGTVAVDKAAVNTARVNLGYTRITAPVSGRVGLRQVDPGNYVTSGLANGLVTITTVRPIDAVFTLPEDDVATVMQRLHGGARLSVTAFDRTQSTALEQGYLLTLDNQIDTTTGTVKAKARFANGDDKLFPNQFVNVRLLVDTLRNAVLAPSSAVLRGQDGLFVWVVDPDRTVHQRTVKIGPVVGDVTAITDGLQPGETLVTDGSDRLRDAGEVLLPGDCPPPDSTAGGKGGRGAGGGHGGGGHHRGGAGGPGGGQGGAQVGADGGACVSTPISRGEGGPAGAGAQARQQKLFAQLDLDAGQQAKVNAITAKLQPKMRAAFQGGDVPAAMAVRQQMQAQIAAVLRPDQQAKYQQLQAQQRAGRGAGGSQGGGFGGGGRRQGGGAPINVPTVQAPGVTATSAAPPSPAERARGGAPGADVPPTSTPVAASGPRGRLSGPAAAAGATTPPASGPVMSGPPGGGNGGGGGRGGGGQALLEQLNLDPGQRAKVAAITGALQPRMRAAYQGGDMAMAMQLRQQMTAQIGAVLRPDQRARYEQLRAQARAAREAAGGGPPGGGGGL